MNWGKWIIVSFLLFAAFIGVLVFFCVREDISLVSADYYKEELAFQDQIERLKNTEGLDRKPYINMVSSSLVVHFEMLPHFDSGDLQLFRPSDKAFDRKFHFSSQGDTIQHFDISRLPAGMYKARMQWKMMGREYFYEQTVNL